MGSTDHNERRLLLFPANCVTWLYNTLSFNPNMEDSDGSGSPSQNKQVIINELVVIFSLSEKQLQQVFLLPHNKSYS